MKNTFPTPLYENIYISAQLFWCLQLRRELRRDLKPIFLWLKPRMDCLYGLWTRVRIQRFSSYLPEESPIVRWTPIQREGRVCLYNLPNPAPFCREGLLCPAVQSVKQMCKLPSSRVGEVFGLHATNQPLSSHVMGNGGVGKPAAPIFTYRTNLDSFIHDQYLPNWNPMLQFFYTRKGYAGK